MNRRVYIVSACLLGLKTRYDGTDELREELLNARDAIYIPLCPEQLGGLPTPRPRMEIDRGDGRDVLKGKARVIGEDGSDVTDRLIRGAEEVLKVAELAGVAKVILKDGSPSCGVNHIKRAGSSVDGMGVTTAMLCERGIDVEGMG